MLPVAPGACHRPRPARAGRPTSVRGRFLNCLTAPVHYHLEVTPVAALPVPDDILREAGLTEKEALVELGCRLFDAGRLTLWSSARLYRPPQFGNARLAGPFTPWLRRSASTTDSVRSTRPRYLPGRECSRPSRHFRIMWAYSAGLDRAGMEDALLERRIAIYRPPVDDVAQDLSALKRLGA